MMMTRSYLNIPLIAVMSILALCCCKPDVEPQQEGEEDTTILLKGGDISELTLVEQKGGKYYWEGKEMDCVKLLAKGGFNIVRLRLYNDPGNPAYTPSKRLPAGIEDEADILRLAKRAKAEGMQIELTFHYSDYWSNGGTQTKPHAWADLSYDELKTAIYDYTLDFLGKMDKQGTLPEYISLGNETQGGILFPDGSYTNEAKMCELYNCAAKAVRKAAPKAKIIIHSDDGGNVSKYEWLFGILKSVDYDVIGSSYYPFWTKKTVAEFISFAKVISAEFKKDIMLMETGYAWNPTLPSGWPGQLSDNGPYKEMTKAGQKAFMDELFGAIKSNPDAHVIGVLYWDPIFIPAGDAGWELGGQNVVSNTTLFDFEGNALPVFESFMKN